jgi:acyl-CoA synthetase (AMP-forming)/AMP-acid ligase II
MPQLDIAEMNTSQHPLRLQVPAWPYQQNNLLSIARQYAQETPDLHPFTFIDYSGDKPTDIPLSYADFDCRARQIAALLQTRGLPGQRVLLLYPAGLDYICAFYGCLYASMIAVPVYPPLNLRLRNRLAAVAEDCSATIALTTTSILQDQGHKSTMPEPLAKLHWLATDEGMDAFEFAWNEPNVARENIAFLQYTSGSTGLPKGVIVTHGNLLHNLYTIALHLQFQAGDHHLTWLPPYHDMGLIGAMLGSFAAGVPVSFMTPAAFLRRPERWLQEISSRRCTISGAPNFAYERCLNKITEAQKAHLDLSSWTLAYSGAEPVRFDTLERFAQQFSGCGFDQRAFYPCYGMAETTLFVTGIDRAQEPTSFSADKHIYTTQNRVELFPSGLHEQADGISVVSCGAVAEGMSIEIVNPGTGLVLPDQSIGEIWVKGPSVTTGYWERETETQATFQATSPNLEGHYLRTGDLGFKYKDQIYICGRLKDLVIIRGVNHYPHDIEATVGICHELIKPTSGIAFSVDKNGEEQLVFVQEIGRRDKERAAEIFAAIRNAIADKHELQPYEIVLIENGQIPKTTSGKLSRQPCRAQYLNQRLPVVAAWTNPLFANNLSALAS